MAAALLPLVAARIAGALAGAGLLALVLVDAFEAIVLPRRATRRYRFSRLFYMTTWRVWAGVARRVRDRKRPEALHSLLGPV